MAEQIKLEKSKDNGSLDLGEFKKTIQNLDLDQNKLIESVIKLVNENQRASAMEKAVIADYLKKVSQDKKEMVESTKEALKYQTRTADEITAELFTEIYKEEKKKRLFSFNRDNLAESAFSKSTAHSLKYYDEKTDRILETMQKAEETYFRGPPKESIMLLR